ncbi:MAG TPA: aminoglycoside phosphotransferase family protein, partial [Candidatus Blautia gallistercoris]|nr:aminoglycoside phosphotransferase family protein [Candidatus Blautia gallistercoris]
MSEAEKYLSEALAAWDFGGELVGAVRYGHGHINDTFCVHTQPGEDPCRRFILQRLSSAAFKHPEQVMANISGVTAYLSERLASEGGNPARETLTVFKTAAGELYYTDSEGSVWRCYPFIEGTVCLQNAETPELFAASGRAFGRFQRELSGYDAGTLYETIPRFHDTEDRLAKLRAAVAADSVGRVAEVGPELEFVEGRAADCSVALEALRAGRLPLRVTHNDTKLNNVLIDRASGEGVCVIDLDTVMPGLSINDFGDSIRFGANDNEEDEPDQSKVHFNLG